MQEPAKITLCLTGIPMAALDKATQRRVLKESSQELLSIVPGEHGLKCVATRDIAVRSVILVESPVATFDMNPIGQGAQFMARPDSENGMFGLVRRGGRAGKPRGGRGCPRRGRGCARARWRGCRSGDGPSQRERDSA